jgi:predicted RNase H-like HicB family nuclease
MKDKEYLVIYEEEEGAWGAYAPDLPGCIAAGASFEETQERMHEAMRAHVDLLRESGESVPQPRVRTEYFATG